MHRGLRGQTKPTDVACVWRNLRPNQNNIKHAVAEIVDPAPIRRDRSYSLLATNFSSFTTSAANLRIPSAVFSVAIAFSFSNQRNFFSSNSNLSIFAAFAFSGVDLRSTGFVDFESCSISSGLIVRQSQPANSRIWPVLRKLAPITSVGISNFL